MEIRIHIIDPLHIIGGNSCIFGIEEPKFVPPGENIFFLVIKDQFIPADHIRLQSFDAQVPQSAVQEDREGPYVLVVDGQNKVVLRRIKTGPFSGSNWAVEKGLVKGEMVIIEGLQKVRPGQSVKATTGAKTQGR